MYINYDIPYIDMCAHYELSFTRIGKSQGWENGR